MEDVVLSKSNQKFNFVINLKTDEAESFSGSLCGIYGRLCTKESKEKLSYKEFAEITKLTNYPDLYSDKLWFDKLVNETQLNEVAVSYDKGCFLGQETAAKIESRRGSAKKIATLALANEFEELEKFPKQDFGELLNLFMLDNHFFIQSIVKRDFFVNGKKVAIKVNEKDINAEIRVAPLLKFDTPQAIADFYYHLGLEYFNKSNDDLALSFLEHALSYDKSHQDLLEAYGVILSRNDKLDEAIDVMKDLITKDPDSVMGHTNLSLYYMKKRRS